MGHQHGEKPEVVAARWKEAGVLQQAQAAQQTADGKFVPGFAATVTIDDPALLLLDRVLDMASADHVETVPSVVEIIEIVGDLDDVLVTDTEIRNLPEDALVAVDPADKAQVVVFTAKQVKEANEALGVTSAEFVPKDKRMWLVGSTVKHLMASKVEPVLKASLSSVPTSHHIYGTPPVSPTSKTAAA